jgi:peptidyl-prolyl cis-trans isomerase SurA
MRKILAIVIIIFFTGQINSSAQSIDKIAGVVGGAIILQSEIETQYAEYISQGNKPDPELKCVILQNLLTQKLLSQQAIIDSVTVEESQVDDAIDRRMRSMVSRAGGEERLEQFLGRSILQYKDQVRGDIREQLVANKMQNKITENVSVTPMEVKRFFESLSKDSLPYINTEVEVGEIVMYPKLNTAEKGGARAKANELLDRIKKGEDFAVLARLYSQDPISAAEGGDLGFFDRTQMVKEFTAVAFKLKAGEVSSVFESEFGFHIMQVTERRGEQVSARHILIKLEPTQSSMDRTKAFSDSIYKGIITKKITFSTAAALYSDNNETKYNGGMLLNEEDVENRSTFIPTDKLDPQVFVVIDTMKVGSYSTPIVFKAPNGKIGYRFLHLKSKTEPHQANLERDFPKIKIAAMADKTDRVVSEWFEKRRATTYVRISPELLSCNNLKIWLTPIK